MKDLSFFAVGLVIGAVLLWMVFEQMGYPGQAQHEANQRALNDSLMMLNRKISTLDAELTVIDATIDQNKKVNMLLQDSLRKAIKTSAYEIPIDSVARSTYLDSIITAYNAKLSNK